MKTARLARRQKSQSKALSANIFVRYGWLLFLFVFLPTTLLTTLASGQLYTGSIAGTVTDPSGAVIPAARVSATDQDKGLPFTAFAY